MLLAFLVGVLLKIYDDFVDDDPILTNEHVIAALRTLQIGLTAVLLATDFWLCVVFLLFNAACAASSPQDYSKPHDLSYVPLVTALVGVSWPTRTSLTLLDGLTTLCVVAGAAVEASLLPEEVSWRKYATRLLGVIASVTTLIWLPQLSPSIVSGLVVWTGYSVTSATVQLLKQTGCIQSKQEETRIYDDV